MAKDLTRDLDDYLKARKRATGIKDFFTRLKNRITPSPKPDIVLPEDMEVYDERATKPFLERIFSKHDPPKELLIRAQLEAEDAKDDLKEVSKIALHIIKQLPDEHLRPFRQSEEFARLKHILKKHELIK